MPKIDFNLLERLAKNFEEAGRHQDAIKIYLFMADGDNSLDGGYLGKQLAKNYEGLGDLQAAKYWYGRAFEENPEVRTDCKEALRRLQAVGIHDLIRGAVGQDYDASKFADAEAFKKEKT